MGGTQDLTGAEFFGQPVKIGEYCRTCGTEHYCDALCFRYSPRYFLCLKCGIQRRHHPIGDLLKAYQVGRLLKGISTPA